MFVDLVGLCEQTIRGHKRRYGRKQGEQTVEDDTCRNGEQPVFGRLVRCSPKNIFPAFPWNFGRKESVPASAAFLRTLKLRSYGFLPALRGTKGRLGFGLFGRPPRQDTKDSGSGNEHDRVYERERGVEWRSGVAQ